MSPLAKADLENYILLIYLFSNSYRSRNENIFSTVPNFIPFKHHQCCVLDLECLPEAHRLKACSPVCDVMVEPLGAKA
jgi:hypothetical protein